MADPSSPSDPNAPHVPALNTRPAERRIQSETQGRRAPGWVYIKKSSFQAGPLVLGAILDEPRPMASIGAAGTSADGVQTVTGIVKTFRDGSPSETVTPDWPALARSAFQARADAPVRLSSDEETIAVWMKEGEPTEEPVFLVLPPAAAARTWAFVRKELLDRRAPGGGQAPNYLRLALDHFGQDDHAPIEVGTRFVAVWLHDEPPTDVEATPGWPAEESGP